MTDRVKIRWVVKFLTGGSKISMILSKKIMSFKEIAVFYELAYLGAYKNWAYNIKNKVPQNEMIRHFLQLHRFSWEFPVNSSKSSHFQKILLTATKNPCNKIP